MTVNINEVQTGEIILKDYMGFGFIAMFTDSFVGGRLDDDGKLCADKMCNYDNLLELRVFNENMELHIYRGSIGDKLKCRLACDDSLAPEFYYDEQQLLDIDTKATGNDNGILVSTRGGKYRLPLSSADEDAVVIRNYISYDEETGRAQITDFRILRFCRAGALGTIKEGK